MRTIMARTPHDSSSRSHFQQIISKVSTDMTNKKKPPPEEDVHVPPSAPRKKPPPPSGGHLSRFRSVVASVMATRRKRGGRGLGTRVTGTLFGHRRGHVHFAFQADPRTPPATVLELATPTATLVKEMTSGLVRIALECERKEGGKRDLNLLEEPQWRALCNGRKCGYALRRECGPADWKVLKAVDPVSMGAGVLPAVEAAEGEMMYMRARFERVVGSKDSEAFYMMNPDKSGGSELSIYFLRV